MSVAFKTDPDLMLGSKIRTDRADFSDRIAYDDHKIKFVIKYARDRDVLNLGCVDHDPEAYKSRYWVHRALTEKAKSVVGFDLSREGVEYLNRHGYDIVHGDAQNFRLDRSFDVIVAGDLIEHLEDFAGFLESCKAHLRPNGSILISTPNPWYWRFILHAIHKKEVPNNPEHTCWVCPRTLRQLVRRHGMDVADIEFGSRYARDRYMPLPSGIKHTSWHARVIVA
jgi:2-polyprenyl-3-methyl-5-hydroxy-6-metoxy-1,4-benzoquinol methylase